MNIDITVLIGLTGTIIGVILGVLGYKKKSENIIKEETTKQTVVSTKLDYISKNVDDIKVDLRAKEKSDQNISERLVKVEESVKSAHHRLDSLEIKKEGM